MVLSHARLPVPPPQLSLPSYYHTFYPTFCSRHSFLVFPPFSLPFPILPIGQIGDKILIDFAGRSCFARPPRGIRTPDRLLKRQLLYQLSYGRSGSHFNKVGALKQRRLGGQFFFGDDD